jgi:hypothetical protein
MLKSLRIRRVGFIALSGVLRNTYRIVIEKCQGKRASGERPGYM